MQEQEYYEVTIRISIPADSAQEAEYDLHDAVALIFEAEGWAVEHISTEIEVRS